MPRLLMPRLLVAVGLVLVPTSVGLAQDTKLSVKVEELPPPKELSEAVRAVLGTKAMTIAEGGSKPLCTIWPVKSVTAKATTEQAESGLKYANLDETTLIGAVKFTDTWIDYRKQKIKPGVYTLRYALQLMDGDHMGTAPYNDFCLLSQAADDTKPDVMTVEELFELSKKASPRKHPAIMLLFPNKQPAEMPVIEAKPKDHTVVSFRLPGVAGDQKTHLGVSLVILGVTTAE